MTDQQTYIVGIYAIVYLISAALLSLGVGGLVYKMEPPILPYWLAASSAVLVLSFAIGYYPEAREGFIRVLVR